MATDILEKIGNEMRRITGTGDNDSYPVMSGVVKAVNEGAQTCSVQLTVNGTDNVTEGVLLNSVSNNGNGMILIPAVDSQVWVAEIDGPGKWGVVRCSNITKAIVKIGGTTEVQMTEGNVVFNGGSNGGIVKVTELVGKLNDTENKLNSLIEKWNDFCASYAPGSPASTGTPATLTTATETALTNTTVDDIKNDNVKH